MQISHSKIECFESCPYKYKLRYLDKIKTIKDTDDANNPLYLGIALHTGIEKDVETAIKEYYAQYPIITDEHINESMKLRYLIPKAKKIVPPGEFEVPIITEHFIGYIDLLTPNEDGTYDLWDFKYSNNVYHYKDSPQLHLYKYFKEKESLGQIQIKNMHYLLVPKVNIRQKKTETLEDFRNRIFEELQKSKIKVLDIEYNADYVVNFTLNIKKSLECEEFEKQDTFLCNWCEYKDLCMKGTDYMILPSNERRNIEKVEKRTLWVYGKPFSGKTTFANNFPDPLMLNTDGNIKFVDAPYIAIKDEVKVNGRMTQRTFAWQIFKDVITELEKKQNDFKTIILDLLEDLYEYCRLYMYDQLGITHESDDSYRAWDKVRIEFLSTLKRLMNLDYENIILISHEDASKDLTKRSGDKITSIKPNIQEKAANKIAGMVDIVARVVAEDNKRILSFKSDEVVFGGGRLTTVENEIELDYERFLEVYEAANKAAVKPKEETTSSRRKSTAKVEEKTNDDAVDAIRYAIDMAEGESKQVEEVVEVKEEVEEDISMKEQMTTAEGVEPTTEEVEVATEENTSVEEKPKRTRKRRTE